MVIYGRLSWATRLSMRLTSNITARNSTAEPAWAVTKSGYRSRPNFALLGTPRPTDWVSTLKCIVRGYASRAASEGKQRTVDGTIKAWRKRIFELIREMLAVERLRQLDDVERCTDAGVPRNFIEAYSPILQWMRGPRLNSAAAARDEVIAEFGGDGRALCPQSRGLSSSYNRTTVSRSRAASLLFSSKRDSSRCRQGPIRGGGCRERS